MANELLRKAKIEKAKRLQGRLKQSGEESLGGEVYNVLHSFASGLNRGVAEGAGSLVDLINLPFGFEEPVGGSQWLQRKGEEAGVIEKEKYPFAGKVGKTVGVGAPFFGAGGVAARTSATGGKYLGPILESYRQTPVYNAVAEFMTGLSAGVGGGVAEQLFPESDTAEMVGELTGGFASPWMWGKPVASWLSKGVRKSVGPMMPGGAERRAAKQVQQLTGQPAEDLARKLKTTATQRKYDLTPAQELQDPNLLRLEAAFKRANTGVADDLAQRRMTNREQLKTDFQDIVKGSPEDTTAFLDTRIKAAQAEADKISNRAIARASESLNELPIDADLEAQSSVVRNQIEKAYRVARTKEEEIWNALDQNAPVGTTNLHETYSDIKTNRLTKAQQSDMPDVIEKHLNPDAKRNVRYGDEESLREIKSFRTKLLEESRREAAQDAPDRNKLAILNEMQNAALKDLEASNAAGPLQAARAYSRELNRQFTEGIIGKVRGYERAGGARVPSEETLMNIIKRGPSGAVRYDALLDAVQGDKKAVKGVENYLGRLFYESAVDSSGKVTPSAANRFLNNYGPVLKRLPGLKDKITSVKSAQEFADRISKRMDLRKRGITDVSRSRAALYVGTDPGKAVRRIFTRRNPDKAMRQLVMQVKKDPTGKALRGLKADILDEMYRAGIRKAGDTTYISGNKMEDFLKKNITTLEEAFDEQELLRIRYLAHKAKQIENAAISGKGLEELLEEMPDVMTDLVMRIVGANIGGSGLVSKASGASLVAAGATSRALRKITNRIPMKKTRDVLAEALLDKDKMRQLLTKVPSPKAAEDLRRRMNSWLVNIIPREDQEATQ